MHPRTLWAARVAAGTVLPDKRLSARLACILETFAERPSDVIPQAAGNWDRPRGSIASWPTSGCYPEWSKNSCGFTGVVFQEPPESFTTLNWRCTLRILADCRKEQHIAFALVIPLMMKMRHILRQRMAERRFPRQDQPRQTLLLDGSHPALRVGVQIWRPRRQGHPLDSSRVKDLLKGGTVFPIPVMDEVLAG